MMASSSANKRNDVMMGSTPVKSQGLTTAQIGPYGVDHSIPGNAMYQSDGGELEPLSLRVASPSAASRYLPPVTPSRLVMASGVAAAPRGTPFQMTPEASSRLRCISSVSPYPTPSSVLSYGHEATSVSLPRFLSDRFLKLIQLEITCREQLIQQWVRQMPKAPPLPSSSLVASTLMTNTATPTSLLRMSGTTPVTSGSPHAMVMLPSPRIASGSPSMMLPSLRTATPQQPKSRPALYALPNGGLVPVAPTPYTSRGGGRW